MDNNAQKHRLQMDVLIKDGEYRKNEREKLRLDMELKQAKRKSELLKIEMEKKKAEFDRISFSQSVLVKEISNLKKQIAGIG